MASQLDAFFAKKEKKKKTEGRTFQFVTTEETAKTVESALTQSKAEDNSVHTRGLEQTASSRTKARQSVGAGRTDKHLSFITFLEDSDEAEFKHYEGVPPSNWEIPENCDLYYLKACQQEDLALEDLHHHLRNYHKLQESLQKAMDACLRRGPVCLKIEARFGKVLWKSDSRKGISDEILSRRYKIKDLEKGGEVSVEDVLGTREIKRDFQTILSGRTTIPDCVEANLQFPEVGDAYRFDITLRRVLVGQKYLIRVKQNRENFELVEVHLMFRKSYIFDCLFLERDLDMRIAMSCSDAHDEPAAAAQMRKVAEELCRDMVLREGCLYVKDPPGCKIEYARSVKQTMYLVSHHDKVHGECPYILAYYQVEDCMDPEMSSSAPGCTEVKLQLKKEHSEVELWNCQWMADFAVLVGKTPEDAFALKYCDPSKIKVHPKDKSEVTAASVIREMDPFVACALELALIDRD